MDANQCATSRGHPGLLFSISLYHYQVKATELLGDVICSANQLLYWLHSLALFLLVVCPMLFCNQ
jgi:hypothetical protein